MKYHKIKREFYYWYLFKYSYNEICQHYSTQYDLAHSVYFLSHQRHESYGVMWRYWRQCPYKDWSHWNTKIPIWHLAFAYWRDIRNVTFCKPDVYTKTLSESQPALLNLCMKAVECCHIHGKWKPDAGFMLSAYISGFCAEKSQHIYNLNIFAEAAFHGNRFSHDHIRH